MKMRFLIVTKLKWDSIPEKLSNIERVIGTARNIGDVEVDVLHKELTPDVANGRVTHDWALNVLKPLADGYDCVCFLFSTYDGTKWGIKSSIGGSQLDFVPHHGIFWVKTNENTVKNEMNSFERIFVHETAHWFADITMVPDYTHIYDYELHNINAIMPTYDLAEWHRLKAQKKSLILRALGLAQQVIEKLMSEKLSTPLSYYDYTTSVTQRFGVYNPRYRSGIHPGNDFGVPENTPVRACADGEVLHVYKNHASMGNAYLYRFEYNDQWYIVRHLHLNSVPEKGKYHKGDILALTGNTGASKGPHLHEDLFKGRSFDFTKLYTELDVRNNFIDSYEFFTKHASKV